MNQGGTIILGLGDNLKKKKKTFRKQKAYFRGFILKKTEFFFFFLDSYFIFSKLAWKDLLQFSF
jgi:hypothetical protein